MTVGIGAVEHERPGQGVDVTRHDLLHVGTPSRPDEIDAHVEHVRAITQLLAGHAHQRVPVLLLQEPLKLPAAVGVGPLGDDEIAVVLPDIDGADEAGNLRLGNDLPLLGWTDPTASHNSFKCSAVVPQHPPTMFTPNSSTNRITPLVKSGGVIGKCALPWT